jgi:hypothetical protein
MTATPTGPGHGAGRYAIRVRGHLDPRWAAWFDGMSLTREADGTTVVHGPVADQAALHGLLHTLRDIGVPLVSVNPVGPEPPGPPTAPTSTTFGPQTERRP